LYSSFAGPGFGPESLHAQQAAGASGVVGKRVVDAFGAVCLFACLLACLLVCLFVCLCKLVWNIQNSKLGSLGKIIYLQNVKCWRQPSKTV